MSKKSAHTPYHVRPSTAIITRGFDPRLSVGSARPAVFRSSTYVFSTPESAERAFGIALGKCHPNDGEDAELIYARISHPNAQILEDQIVPLEPKAKAAAVFNSGLAAISTILFAHLRPGSTLIHTMPLYGGTQHLLSQLFEPFGIRCVSVPAGKTSDLSEAIGQVQGPSVVLMETPANPTLRMTDIRSAADAARSNPNRPLVVVDNTFLGPAFQHPLQFGADLVVYSATKYLAGFSDMLGGVVLTAETKLIQPILGMRGILGNILQPDECWLLCSRLPTVVLRMNRQSKNAQRIAERLVNHEKIERVIYPTLFDDTEQIRIRDAQTEYPGGVFAIRMKGGKKAAFDLLRNLKIARNAVSLGGIESLACHPATTTHSEMTSSELESNEIDDGLVRFSVGIEDWRDLLEDILQALR